MCDILPIYNLYSLIYVLIENIRALTHLDYNHVRGTFMFPY